MDDENTNKSSINNNPNKIESCKKVKFIVSGKIKPPSNLLLSYAHGGNVQSYHLRNPNSYTDFDMIAKGVAVFIQNLTAADFNRKNDPNNPFNKNYNKPPIESVEYIQFSVTIKSRKNINGNINIFVTNNKIPRIADIYKFLKYLKIKLDFTPPNLILTCIYLKRICETANIPLNKLNYQLLFLVTLIIAQKIWMEPYKQTEEFAVIFPDSYNKDILRLYERDLLTIIYHNTKIKPNEYGHMYQILKNLSKNVEIVADIQSVARSVNSAGSVPSVNSDTSKTSLSNQSINEYSDKTFKVTKISNGLTGNTTTTIKSNIIGNNTDDISTLTEPINKLNLPLKRDAIELKIKGFTYDQIKSNDYTIYDFIYSGYQIPDLLDANFTLTDLLNVKKEINDSDGKFVETNYYSINELKVQGGFKISDFTALGYTLNDLKYAGYLAKDYVAHGITIRQLIIQNGYTVDDLIRLKFTPLQLDEYGINNDDKSLYQSVSYTISQLVQQPNKSLNKLTVNDTDEVLKIPNELNTYKYKKVRSLYFTSDNHPSFHNLSNPDVEEILFCISFIIQAQIFQDLNVNYDLKLVHNDFDVIPDLLPEFGGEFSSVPDRILKQETPALRQELLAFNVPTIYTILKYLALIRSSAHYAAESNIMGLILLNRLTSVSKIPLKSSNWRSLWLICVIIAQKIWEDNPMKSPDFSFIISAFTPQILLDWEMKVLTLLDWSVTIKPSTYSIYFFDLRQLYSEISGPRCCTTIDLKYKPIARKYLFNLIEGSKTRGVKNYSKVNGKHKIESLATNKINNAFKSEDVYQYDNIVNDISESKDDSYIDRKSRFLPSGDKLRNVRISNNNQKMK